MIPQSEQNQRLSQTIAAVCPIHGVAITGPTSARIDYDPTATAPQKTAAQSALATFDWTEPAHIAWRDGQVKALAKEWILGDTVQARAFRAQSLVILDQVNALRTAAGLIPPTYTSNQFLNSVIARVDTTP
jgi:hypothetical protein